MKRRLLWGSVCVVALLDLFTPLGYVSGVWYVLPIAFAGQLRDLMRLSLFSLVLTLLLPPLVALCCGWVPLTETVSPTEAYAVNRFASAVAILVTALLTAKVIQVESRAKRPSIRVLWSEFVGAETESPYPAKTNHSTEPPKVM